MARFTKLENSKVFRPERPETNVPLKLRENGLRTFNEQSLTATRETISGLPTTVVFTLRTNGGELPDTGTPETNNGLTS